MQLQKGFNSNVWVTDTKWLLRWLLSDNRYKSTQIRIIQSPELVSSSLLVLWRFRPIHKMPKLFFNWILIRVDMIKFIYPEKATKFFLRIYELYYYTKELFKTNLKFGFSKKATWCDEIFILIWILLSEHQINWEISSNVRGLLRKPELYSWLGKYFSISDWNWFLFINFSTVFVL